MQVSVRIAGIPALVDVVYYLSVPGSYSRDEVSDWDYYGYEELDYVVCDRRGRPAPWLERKMSDDDREAVSVAVGRAYKEVV